MKKRKTDERRMGHGELGWGERRRSPGESPRMRYTLAYAYRFPIVDSTISPETRCSCMITDITRVMDTRVPLSRTRYKGENRKAAL